MRPQGTKCATVADARLTQRGRGNGQTPTPISSLYQPLQSLVPDKRSVSSQKLLQGQDTSLHVAQQELEVLATGATAKSAPVENSCGGKDLDNGFAKSLASIASLSKEEMKNLLVRVISKQNSDWNARQHSVLERREREMFAWRHRECHGSRKKSDISAEPLCMLLHLFLTESRSNWGSILSSRMRTLNEEIHQQKTRTSCCADSASSDESEDEWSVGQLYHALVTGLNSASTEELITTRMFGGDASAFYSSIDSFGLLTVFRAPIQELLARCDVLAPSLTTLRRHFAALHPLNGSPRIISHTEPCLHAAEEMLNTLLQHGNSPEVVASALRGAVIPSLRRLLYARALQIPLVVTDGTSIFGGRGGELQGNQHSDMISGCLSFATKHSRDKIRRRMHHSYATRDHESTAKMVQAIMKVDNTQFVGNSDKYFIFAEETELLALSLIADRSILDLHLKNTLRQMGRPSEQIDSYIVFFESFFGRGVPEQQRQQRQSQSERITIPSGFFPVGSCSMLIAPLCYVTGDTVEQYELLAAIFGQLWCRIQGPTPELAQCCWIFEALVMRFAADACLHATRTLGYPPLRLAIQWMVSGFVEVLEPQELLSFWDLILSYHIEEMFSDSTLLNVLVHEKHGVQNGSSSTPCALWLLPLMAASLFVYRAPLVSRCSSYEEMLFVFKEAHHICCRQLLQYLLFMAK